MPSNGAIQDNIYHRTRDAFSYNGTIYDPYTKCETSKCPHSLENGLLVEDELLADDGPHRNGVCWTQVGAIELPNDGNATDSPVSDSGEDRSAA